MRRKPTTVTVVPVPVRIAWWVSFFATLALIAILSLAKSAQALSLPPASGVDPVFLLAPAANEAEDEEEDEAEASEDEGLEAEECEAGEEEECEDESGAEAPAECLLSGAQAKIFASGNRDRVRLQIRYTTTSPTAVAVDYGLHGAKGSLYLGSEKKHFGKKGVLRLNRDLTEAQMAKVMAAKDFTVRIRALTAPRYCQPFFDRHLTVRRATPAGLTWLQSNSAY
jgi:hypothetical protein